MTRLSILNSIVDERVRQDEKWGDQSEHPATFWYAVLGEEVGEVANAILNDAKLPWYNQDDKAIEKELIQVAAVAVAWLEAMER